MTAATGPRYLGTMDDSPRQFPIGTVVPKQGWLMGRYPVGSPNAGKVDPIGTDPNLVGVGVSRFSVSTGAVPATAQEVYCDPGIVPLFATSVDETWEGQPVYGVDNQTVQLTDGGGQYPLVGVGWWAESTTVIHCKVGPPGMAEARATLAAGAGRATAPVARAVLLSLGAYTLSNGTLTVTSTGAIGTQDGVTGLAAGQIVFLPAGTAIAAGGSANDSGTYEIINPGGTGIQVVLERVGLLTGNGIPQCYTVDIGAEGTEWGGSTWRTMCASGQVVDTNDPQFYPRFWKKKITLGSGTYQIGHGGGGEDLYLWSTSTPVELAYNTRAGTPGVSLAAPSASRTAAYPSTATITVNSYSAGTTVAGSDSSTVDVVVGPNW